MVNRYIEKIASRRWPITAAIGAGGAAFGAGAGYLDAKNKKLSKKDTKKHVRNSAVAYGVLGAGYHRMHLGGKLAGNKIMRGVNSMKNKNPAYGEMYKAYRSTYKFKPQVGAKYKDVRHFGVNPGSFKTKAQFDKHFKKELHKWHPDKHQGSTESKVKFQQLSTARDRIHKSDWYNKLK